MFEKIVEACHFLLNNYPGASQAQAYLNSRLSLESQENFQFGYFPNSNDLNVLTDLVGLDILKKQELYYNKEIADSLGPRTVDFLYFEDYPIVMPFRNTYGKVVAMVGRTLLDDELRAKKKISKYKNTKNNQVFRKGHCVFGLFENKEDIIRQDMVLVVEGQMDVIKAAEVGFKNIVALGTSNMTSYQFSVISRYTNNINLLLDNDEAGIKGRDSIANKFGKLANIQNFYLPKEYKDIDEYITKANIGNCDEISFNY